jgi:hypothetical protein
MIAFQKMIGKERLLSKRFFKLFDVYVFDYGHCAQLLNLNHTCGLTLSFSFQFSLKRSNCHGRMF